MSFKKQFKKIKENWLFLVIGLVFLFALAFLFSGGQIGQSMKLQGARGLYESDSLSSYSKSLSNYPANDSFAPGEDVRKIIKNASMSLQIKKGEFKEKDKEVSSIVNNTDSYLINKNTSENTYGLYSSSYNIKVNSKKLDFVVDQLKSLGKVKSLRKGLSDITGEYVDTNIEIQVEKEKLKRYNQLYNDLKDTDEKVDLINKIFSQERRIKYLEDSIKSMNEKTEFSTINFSMSEHTNYINIAFVKFSDLLKTLVGSVNVLLTIVFAVIPFIVLIFLVWLIAHFVRRKKK